MKTQQIPHDALAEQSVIGSLLIDGEAIGLIDLEVADFFDERNQIIYQAMLNTYGQIDEVTVAHQLKRMGKIEEIGGLSYLPGVISQTPTSIHLKYYSDIVKKCAFSRRLISTSEQIAAIGYNNAVPEDSIDKLSGIMRKVVGSVNDDSILKPDDVTQDALVYYTDNTVQPAIESGIPSFDRLKGGYLMGEYVMLAARTGVGKTTYALQEACHIAKTRPVLFFSMEMFQRQVMNKIVSRITGITENAMSLKGYYSELDASTGKIVVHKGFAEKEQKSILDALDQFSKLQLYIVEGNRSLDSIRRVVERQLNLTGCEMVFIDYLGLIREKQGKDGHDRMNYLSEELSRMPKEYRIPFKVLHQLNRDIERRDGLERAPKIIDMREGGEESVDLLQMLCHCTDNPYQSQLFIHKDRLRGETGVITVNWHSGSYS